MYIIRDYDTFFSKDSFAIASDLSEQYTDSRYQNAHTSVWYRHSRLHVQIVPHRFELIPYGFSVIGKIDSKWYLSRFVSGQISYELFRDGQYPKVVEIETRKHARAIIHYWMMYIDAFRETRHKRNANKLVQHYRTQAGFKS